MKRIKLFSVLALSAMTITTLSTTAFAEEAVEYHSHGVVEFRPNTDPTDPVDPENPDPENPVVPTDPSNPGGEPEPGTQGPLSIDYASTFDFGVNKISNKDETYYARAQHYNDGHSDTPDYVQVTDNRGTNSGWKLTVKESGQLTATTDTLNKVLTGAQITLAHPNVTSNASGVTAPTAAEDTWEDYWGKVESVQEEDEQGAKQDVNITKDVALSVPGSTPKDAVKYQTTLTWTLTDVPSN